MKFSLLFLSSLFLTAFSQTITILSPPADAMITPGQNLTVQLGFPVSTSVVFTPPSTYSNVLCFKRNSLTGVKHISAVIAMMDCHGQPCTTSADSTIGIPLFAGNYTPQLHEPDLVSSSSLLPFHLLRAEPRYLI